MKLAEAESKRIIALTIWFMAMLILPVLTEVYYATLYYAGVFLLIPIAVHRIVRADKYEKKFYEFWHTAREQGFWVNVVREGLRTMIIITMVVVVIQFLINGYTPVYIVSKLSGDVWILLLSLLLGFGLLGGIVAWYENDKRYYRIHYSNEKQQ